jgi:hypothetical protein
VEELSWLALTCSATAGQISRLIVRFPQLGQVRKLERELYRDTRRDRHLLVWCIHVHCVVRLCLPRENFFSRTAVAEVASGCVETFSLLGIQDIEALDRASGRLGAANFLRAIALKVSEEQRS